MINLKYLMDHILFKIILIISSKYEKVTNKPSMIIYVNNLENKITFKIKAGYYLQPLMPKTMNLLECPKNKTTKDENGENVPRLQITDVVLNHCNIVKLHKFVPNKSFDQLLDISRKNLEKPLIQNF